MLRLPLFRDALPAAVTTDFLLLEMCGNYEVATLAARHWAGSTEPQAASLAEEYIGQLKELEREVASRVLQGALRPASLSQRG